MKLEKILSFTATLGLIAWNVIDISRGNGSVLNWIMVIAFSLIGLFELGSIFESEEVRKTSARPAAVFAGKTGAAEETHTAMQA